jgi:hypothetical protein
MNTTENTTPAIILTISQVKQLQNELRSQKAELRKKAEAMGALVETSKDTATGHAKAWKITVPSNAGDAEKKLIKGLAASHKALHGQDENLIACFNLLQDKSDRIAAKATPAK